MKKSINLYYLYCTNMQCRLSIFHRNVELRIHLNAENLVTTYNCSCCDKPLMSALDMAIKNIVNADYQANHLNN